MNIQKQIISILIFLSFFLINSCSQNTEIKGKIKTNNNIKKIDTNKINKEKIEQSNFQDALQRNLKIKKLIETGDKYLNENEYILALRKYLKAKAQSPYNKEILKKLGDTYFLMKKYDKSLKYYEKINNIEIVGVDRYILNLIYTTNFPEKQIEVNLTSSGTVVNKEETKNTKNIELEKTINFLKERIWSINTTKQKRFYYSNSISCLLDFRTCKEEFKDFFNQKNLKLDETKLIELKKNLKNYENFGVEELYLKNTYLIAGFFKEGLYPVSINLSKELLEEKINYKPILKIIAQSYFELGDLKYTKKYLSRYYALDSSDYDVAYMLGVVNQKLHNYLLSNIQFTKALELGAKGKSKNNIYRLEIYNFLILKDFKKILATFDKLIEENKTPDFNDLILATYYNIINGDIRKARKYAELGINIYPQEEDFYGFKGWILEKKGQNEKAKEEFLKGHKIDNRNALINYHLGKIMLASDSLIQARIYFKRAEKLDKGGDISILAIKGQEEIKRIKELEKQEEK